MDKKTKPIDRRAVVRRYPWLRHFPHAEVVVDEHGVWCFRKNRIVDNMLAILSTATRISSLIHANLNTISVDQQNGNYTLDELMELYMLLGVSLGHFADTFARHLADWSRAPRKS